MNMVSVHNGESWNLVSVYGPCQGTLRDQFVQWLYNLDIPHISNWLLLGDFNFFRSFDNRNKPGGDVNGMLIFNDIIGHLGLLELPLKVENILGQICSSSPFWSHLIGFLLVPTGFQFTQILSFFL
jgi:hypothetical protein